MAILYEYTSAHMDMQRTADFAGFVRARPTNRWRTLWPRSRYGTAIRCEYWIALSLTAYTVCLYVYVKHFR